MPHAWQSAGGRCRSWVAVPSTVWCYSASGDLVSAHGPRGALGLMPSDAIVSSAQAAIARVGAPIAQAVRDAESNPQAQDFYLRALLTIGQHESRFGPLPMWGDCLSEGGGVVPCSSPAATGEPRAAGWFQLQRSTARGIGVDWAALATSPEANIQDALRLALHLEEHHGLDFPTLVAYWAAGGVYPMASNDWGARASGRHTFTEFARIWNAIGDVHASAFPPVVQSHPGRAALGGALLLGTMITVAFVKR